MFRIEISPDALKELVRLDEPTKRRIAGKIEWLSANADKITHHRLSNLPSHLRGLCKRREGDWRILYWLYPSQLVLKVYSVIHRSSGYDLLR
ncbi:MAG: type II toxin-antitoxin system RelE/ParE family toxin [Planctomycetes bacterium]|nr:type II toxin-antitoxin system RelE/ParE family toxin [Planctomycetota bacterium]